MSSRLVRLAVCMLVFGGFSVEHSVVARATSPELEVTAPSQVRLGEAIRVTLTLSGADQVAGYEALARFDEHAAEFGGLFPGGEDAPAATANTAIADGAKDGTAFAVYTCVTSGCPTAATSVLEGSQQLRNVTLRIVPDRAGILEIDLDQVRFVDSLGNRLDVGVSGNHLAVVVASGATPIAAPAGDFVLSDNPVTTPNAPTAGPNPALDVTGDGSVTSADVSMVSLAWVHAREVGGVCSAEPGADVNGDGCVDVSDLQAVASTTDPTVATAPRAGATTAARPSIEAAAVPGTGQQFVVDTDSDLPDISIGNGICATSAGTCSLRAAVHEANAINGPNSIVFNIPGAGVHTIHLTTSLNITDATGGVTIDGYSQPGATPNTDPLASNAQIKIEIRGDGTSTAVGTFDGIRVVSANNTLRGIAVYNANDQVHLVGSGANHNRIIGDFIGTNAAATSTSPLGAFASSGGNGLHLESGSHDNVFGTPDLADRNVFDGAPYAGIRIDHVHSNANIIQNNIFGLTPNGLGKLPNRQIGIDLQWGASHNKIGGLGPRERNVLSGQPYDAVDLSHSTATSFNEVVGNFIGTTLDGESVTSYSRTHFGIAFKDDIANNLVHDNVIGGANQYPIWHKHDYTGHNDIYDNRIGVSLGGRPLPNSKWGMFMQGHDFTVRNNIFANSASGGIFLTSDISDRDTFTGNTFFNNGGLAIDLAPAGPTANDSVGHAGPNSNLNYPVLTTVTTTSAAGTACANCRVELYRSTLDTGNRGEGNLLLGTAVAGPDGVFAATLTGAATADLVAAIAIDPTGNTSEFSTVVKATGVTPPPTTPPPTAPPTVPTPPVASLPPTAEKFVPLQPARLLDTRPGATTVDNQDAATGIVGAGDTYELTIGGRGGVPVTATAAVLNVTATEATGSGFVTVYPCGSPQPLASNLNYTLNQTIPNTVIAKLGTDGKICLFTQRATHLVVDVDGAFTASG